MNIQVINLLPSMQFNNLTVNS